eukprot:COSAG03_NODE_26875_length_256_cov_0.993631_1_plen_46_part_10
MYLCVFYIYDYWTEHLYVNVSMRILHILLLDGAGTTARPASASATR